MFKLAKSGLLSVALLATVVVKASKIVTVSSPGAKVVNITLSDVSEGEILSIVDADGVKLLEETLTQSDSFTKTINFSTLESGVYFLETRKAKEVNVTPVIVKSKSVSIVPSLTKTYTAPKIQLDGTLAKIFINNFDKSLVEVSIYDNTGKEVKLESSKDLIVYRFFNFSNLGSGTYSISVNQGKHNFTEEVKF